MALEAEMEGAAARAAEELAATKSAAAESATEKAATEEALAPLVPGQSMALWRWRTCKLRLWSRYYAVQFLVRTLQCFRESVSNVRDALRMAVGVRTAPQQLVLQRWLEDPSRPWTRRAKSFSARSRSTCRRSCR